MESNETSSLDVRIAARVRLRRQELGLTLDQLAARADVSRAMISRVERAEVSSTAALLGKLANALGFTLSTLFSEGEEDAPIVRAKVRRPWRDPGSGYQRRDVASNKAPVDIVDVTLPPGARVAYDNAVPLALEQVVWVLEGTLSLTSAGATYILEPGDSLLMRLDSPTVFENTGATSARYAVVLATYQLNLRSLR